MTPEVRRIVAGQDDGEGPVVTADEMLVPRLLSSGLRFWLVWGTDEVPIELPTPGELQFQESTFPPERGVRVLVVDYPPASDDALPPAANARPGELPTDLGKTVSSDPESGLHMTDTVDIAIVLRGEIGLEQGDGVQTTLREGDILIQHGGLHAWRRRDVGCRLAFIILGATRTRGPTERPSPA